MTDIDHISCVLDLEDEDLIDYIRGLVGKTPIYSGNLRTDFGVCHMTADHVLEQCEEADLLSVKKYPVYEGKPLLNFSVPEKKEIDFEGIGKFLGMPVKDARQIPTDWGYSPSTQFVQKYMEGK